jgi:hypothetical protein
MRYFGLENVNFKKSSLSKMKRLCLGDSEDVFESKIGQVVTEKNEYELDAAIQCILLYSVHNDLLPLDCPFFCSFSAIPEENTGEEMV